jgi:hypothetical protein
MILSLVQGISSTGPALDCEVFGGIDYRMFGMSPVEIHGISVSTSNMMKRLDTVNNIEAPCQAASSA